MKKAVFISISGIILFAGILFAVRPEWFPLKQKRIYLAVVGPMSGADKHIGREMRQGISLYTDKINRQGGINGRRMEILYYNDQNEPYYAEKVAESIAQNVEKKVLLVIGHGSNETCLSAGHIYKRNEIPSITASATDESITKDSDWYFRTVPDIRFQAAFIANYIKNDMKYNAVTIVHRRDSLGTSFMNSFTRVAETIGIKIVGTFRFFPEKKNPEKEYALVADQVTAMEQTGAILMTTRASETAKIIPYLYSFRITDQVLNELINKGVPDKICRWLETLIEKPPFKKDRFIAELNANLTENERDQYQSTIFKHAKYPRKNYLIVGTPEVSEKTFLDTLKKESIEKEYPGIYSDGIHSISPFMAQIADQEAYSFQSEYMSKYKEKPTWIAAGYYDAVKVAVEAIQAGNLQDMDLIRHNRREIRSALLGFSDPKTTVKGVSGDIYFDADGNVKRPYAVGQYKNHQFIPFFSQYQSLNETAIENVFKQALDGRIIVVTDKVMKRTRVVYTGIHVNEIVNLDIPRSRYAIDFYIWFRHRGNFNEQGIQFYNFSEKAARNFAPYRKLDKSQLVFRKKNDGILISLYHVKADFKGDFDFHAYPFDRHVLEIKYRHPELTREELIFVEDSLPLPDNIFRFFPELEKDRHSNEIVIHGKGLERQWEIEGISFYQNIIEHMSTLGNPRYFNSGHAIRYSQFNTEINIRQKNRKITNDVFIMCIGSIALILWLSMFIPIARFSGRILLCIFAAMATAYCHQKFLANWFFDYLLAAEFFIFAVYGLCLFSALISILSLKLYRKAKSVGKSIESTGDELVAQDLKKQYEQIRHKIVSINRMALYLYPILLISGYLIFTTY